MLRHPITWRIRIVGTACGRSRRVPAASLHSRFDEHKRSRRRMDIHIYGYDTGAISICFTTRHCLCAIRWAGSTFYLISFLRLTHRSRVYFRFWFPHHRSQLPSALIPCSCAFQLEAFFILDSVMALIWPYATCPENLGKERAWRRSAFTNLCIIWFTFSTSRVRMKGSRTEIRGVFKHEAKCWLDGGGGWDLIFRNGFFGFRTYRQKTDNESRV